MGSANFGTRGVSYTKELGILVKDCALLGEDARKIFELYRSIDGVKKLPRKYSRHYKTWINDANPVSVYNTKDDTIYKVLLKMSYIIISYFLFCFKFIIQVFIASSPRTLCGEGRTDDLQAILHVINSAREYIHIAVHEYIPMDLWKKREPWPVIDDAIRLGKEYN